MNNLVIDIGNSGLKLAIFHQRKLVQKLHLQQIDLDQIRQLVDDYGVENSLVSSVSQDAEELTNFLKTITVYQCFSSRTALPLINQYKSPETLGSDRLAGLMGARYLYPEKPVLVIDAGTCITYDLIDEQSRYEGGSISPGIHMRLKALHHFTGKLPLVDFESDFEDLIGRDTRQSILSGVINGVLAEAEGFIQKYSQLHAHLQVILCGGDARFFDTRLKNSIFANHLSCEPDLVLIGLNEVICHQHDQ